jgi:hypothetical protein
MGENLTFEWIFISWAITFVIHLHSIKRTTITDNKDSLIDLLSLLSELKWIGDSEYSLYLEDRYNNKVARIAWKLKQLNNIASCSLISEEKLNALYNFDIEAYLSEEKSSIEKEQLKFDLQESCDDMIDTIEQTYFTKIATSRVFILWAARYTAAGILFSLFVIYYFFEIMSFLYG